MVALLAEIAAKTNTDWYVELLACALSTCDSTDEAIQLANQVYGQVSEPPFPDEVEIENEPEEGLEEEEQPIGVGWPDASAQFAFDIHDRKLQGTLNRALAAAKKLSAPIRVAIEDALELPTPQQQIRAIGEVLTRYRVKFADLLGNTTLAALMQGMVAVARQMPSIPPPGSASPLPPSLAPDEAQQLVERLRQLSGIEQEIAIQSLPVEQQSFIRASIVGGGPPATPPPAVPGSPRDIHFPILEEAMRELHEKNLVTRQEFDRMDDAARAKAFTVAEVDEQETLGKIRDVLTEQIRTGVDLKDFREKVFEEVEPGTFLSDAHLETVFRTNIQRAFSDGQRDVLSDPMVQDGFPYATYNPIHDDRVRDEHLALEKKGIQGTNVYRLDDPVFKLFEPPWDYNCRCNWNPISIRTASEKGIREAQNWLATGVEPETKAWVAMPDFEPSPTFRRSLSGMPLSIQLSLLMPVHLATTWTQYQGMHGGRGWRNTATGEIRYQQAMPTDRGEGQQPGQPQSTQPQNAEVAKLHGRISVAIDRLGLTDAKKTEYKNEMQAALQGMPKGATQLLSQNLRAVRFHPDLKTLNSELAAQYPNIKSLLEKGGAVMGAAHRDGVVELDGGSPNEAARETYAHELCHIIDKDHQLSDSQEWKAAWQNEIAGGMLSEYATTNPAEGFAEFGRFVYIDVRGSKARIEQRMPLCAAFWKKRGLL